MSKKMACTKVTGFVGGNNTRSAWSWMENKEVNAVMFRSELMGEEDTRAVIVEMLAGKDATDASKKKVVGWVKEYDSNGPNSQWALTNSILKDGQQEPCKVVLGEGGAAELFSGARRWFGNLLGSVLLPDGHKAEFDYDPYEGDTETARELGHILNASHKELHPLDEGKRYFDMKELGLSDKTIAERLQVFDVKGKLNIQRVGQYRKLYHKNITDADRAKFRAGTATMQSLLNKVTPNGKPDAPVGRQDSRPRTMTYTKAEPFTKKDTLTTLFAQESITKKFEGKEGTERDIAIAQFVARILTQKDELPAKVMEAVFPTEAPEAPAAGDANGGEAPATPKKKGKKGKKAAKATPAPTAADANNAEANEGAPAATNNIAV